MHVQCAYLVFQASSLWETLENVKNLVVYTKWDRHVEQLRKAGQLA